MASEGSEASERNPALTWAQWYMLEVLADGPAIFGSRSEALELQRLGYIEAFDSIWWRISDAGRAALAQGHQRARSGRRGDGE